MWPKLTRQLSAARSFSVEKEVRKLLSDECALIIHGTYISFKTKKIQCLLHISLTGIDSFPLIFNRCCS